MYKLSDIKHLKEICDYTKFYKDELGIIKETDNIRNGKVSICCPLHIEKSPSFEISMRTGLFRCYGSCQTYGDVFDLLQKLYNITLSEAVRMVAKFCDYEIEESEEWKQEREHFNKITKFNLKLLKHFKENLIIDHQCSDYITSRGITSKSINAFHLGAFIPNKIMSFIQPNEYDIALDVGVLKKTDDGKIVPFSNCKRIMFPYIENNRIITFTGRAIFEDVKPKYNKFQNSSIHNGSELIYGIDNAKDSIRKYKNVVLTEGQMDVIKSHQNGVLNIVGISGLKPSESQLYKLRKLTSSFYIILEDNSSLNGLKKTYDIIKEIIKYPDIRIIKLYKDSKLDLSDYFDNNKFDDFNKLKEKAPFYNSFVIDNIIKSNKIETIEDRVKVLRMLKNHLHSIKDYSLRNLLIETISNKIGISELDIQRELKTKEKYEMLEVICKPPEKFDKLYILRLKKIIGLLLNDNYNKKTLLNLFYQYKLQEYFLPEYKKIYDKIMELYLKIPKSSDIINELYNDSNVDDSIIIDIVMKSEGQCFEECELEQLFAEQENKLKQSFKLMKGK